MSRQYHYTKKKQSPERTECTLVWKDGSKCQATVPVGADEVLCGTKRFRRDHRHKALTYVEQS